MFQSITWGAYLYCLFIIIPIYYTVVLVLYFRRDVAGLFTKGKHRQKLGGTSDDLVDSP